MLDAFVVLTRPQFAEARRAAVVSAPRQRKTGRKTVAEYLREVFGDEPPALQSSVGSRPATDAASVLHEIARGVRRERGSSITSSLFGFVAACAVCSGTMWQTGDAGFVVEAEDCAGCDRHFDSFAVLSPEQAAAFVDYAPTAQQQLDARRFREMWFERLGVDGGQRTAGG